MAVYRSNLIAPDLRPLFALRDPPMQHCGYDAPSDPDFDPDCGYWTVDEAAILYNVVRSVGPNAGTWIDIGARFGWTAAHMIAAGARVILVDPELWWRPQSARMGSNLRTLWDGVESVMASWWMHAAAQLRPHARYDGFVIDGCHDSPDPLEDAQRAAELAERDCIILFHDTLGTAVRDGVRWLMNHGWRCRMYWTPNGVACCWRGYPAFRPPDHIPDPKMDFRPHKAAMVDMVDYWSRCE